MGSRNAWLLSWLAELPAAALWLNSPQSDYDIVVPGDSPTVFRPIGTDARVDYYEQDVYPRGSVRT